MKNKLIVKICALAAAMCIVSVSSNTLTTKSYATVKICTVNSNMEISDLIKYAEDNGITCEVTDFNKIDKNKLISVINELMMLDSNIVFQDQNKEIDNTNDGIEPLKDVSGVESDRIAQKDYKVMTGVSITLNIRYDLYREGSYKEIYSINKVTAYPKNGVNISQLTIRDFWYTMKNSNKSANIEGYGSYQSTIEGVTATKNFNFSTTLYAGD